MLVDFLRIMDSGEVRKRLNEIRKTLRETEKAISEINYRIAALKRSRKAPTKRAQH